MEEAQKMASDIMRRYYGSTRIELHTLSKEEEVYTIIFKSNVTYFKIKVQNREVISFDKEIREALVL